MPRAERDATLRVLACGFALALVLSLSACGVGVKQSPASDEDTGTVHAVDASGTYTTQAGDTLITVSARPDVYGDPELWPLLYDANTQALAGLSPRSPIAADTVLVVPRNVSQSGIEAARARARAAAAGMKASDQAEDAAIQPPTIATAFPPAGKPVVSALPRAVPSSAVTRALAGTPAVTGVPSAVPTPMATAVAPAAAKSGRTLPMLLLLLLVLAALVAVVFVFFRRDKKDFD